MRNRRSHRSRGDKDFIVEISDSSEEEGYKTPLRSTNYTTRQESVVSRSSREIVSLVSTVFSDAVEAFLSFVWLVQKPLTYAAAVYVGLICLNKATNSIEHQVRVLFTPICSAPILGAVFPLCPYITKKPPVDPDYARFIALQQSFEPILALTAGAPPHAAHGDAGFGISTGGSSLSLSYDIRNSEAAVRDLAVLVKLSNLPSKEELGRAINDFVGNAKETARGLQRLGAKVGGAVDSVLAMDEYVLRRLEEINRSSSSLPSSVMSLQAFFDHVLPASLNSAQMRRARNHDMLVSNFLQASNHLASHLQRLIREAEGSLALLNRLEENVDVMNEMISRESILVKQEKDRIMADLWTILGGNRDRLETQDSHIELLGSLTTYRKEARDRVSRTIEELTNLEEDLEELRGRVAEPWISTLNPIVDANGYLSRGSAGGIPLEVHMDSIKKGVTRLSLFRQGGIQMENERLNRMIADGGAEIPRGLPTQK